MQIILLILALIALGLLFWQISNLVSVFFGSLYVSSGTLVAKRALAMANLKEGEVFFDLGCGKGDVLVLAAKTGAKVIGLEISPYYYLWSKVRALTNKNITVKFQDLRSVDYSKADVIYCYLLPHFVAELAPKFKDLKKKARVVSISFRVPGLKLAKKTKYRGITIYIHSASSRAV